MDPYNEKVQEGHRAIQEVGKTATTTAVSYRQLQGGVPAEITSLRLVNRNGTRAVRVSVDGGSNFLVVLPLQDYGLSLNSVNEIQVSTASGTAVYDLFYTVRP